MGLRGAECALVLDDGKSCAEIAHVFYIDDDRVRTWHRQYLKGGWGFVVLNDWHGGQSPMSLPQKTTLYERLMTELAADEAIYFADATHPEHQSKPAYGWVRRGSNPALRRTSGRGRVNIHGAVNLENFDGPFVEPTTVDGKSAVQLLAEIEARNPDKRKIHKRKIHVIRDNAPCHRGPDLRA